jgi:C-terminal processing protease CtpA/Prc
VSERRGSTGDRILSVDKQSTVQIPLDRVNRWLWLSEKARIRLELVDSKGERRVVVLR